MAKLSRLFSIIFMIALIAVVATAFVGCEEEEADIVIKSYQSDYTYTVGDEFNPTVTFTKTDDTTATLTLLTNPGVELPDNYKSTLKLVENDEKLEFGEVGEYSIDVLYLGEPLTLNFTVEEKE